MKNSGRKICEIVVTFLVTILVSNICPTKSFAASKTEKLVRALEIDNFEKAEKLLLKGADPNALTESGIPVIHIAVDKNALEILKLMISKGANVNSIDSNGNTPLHLAAERGYIEFVKILVSNGTDISIPNSYFRTALHLACSKGNLEIVDFLVSRGSDIKCRDNNGWTPLHFAAKSGSLETVKLLVAKGADINAKSRENLEANRQIDLNIQRFPQPGPGGVVRIMGCELIGVDGGAIVIYPGGKTPLDVAENIEVKLYLAVNGGKKKSGKFIPYR
ncbi:ankyrin repeat domain-containing protein [bacterium]|nr:ankyrin repeat domain-containing protein [candidate division CSSED10-310 bacterium]